MKINSEKFASNQKNSKFALTTLEIIFNRIFAVLLVLATVLLFLNPLTIPTMILFALFGIFLFFSKKYHPIRNIIFFLFALGVYFIPLPIDWGLFLGLIEFRFNGFIFNLFFFIFYLAPFLFVSLATRNVFGNITSFFKPSRLWRNLFYIFSLITIMVVVLAYPLFSSLKLRERAMEDDDGSSKLSYVLTKQELKIKPGETSAGSSALSRDYTMHFDSTRNKYIYRLYLEDPLAESITFKAIRADAEKINFVTDNLVTCLNCQKDVNNPFSLIFPAGKNIDFIVTSDQWIKKIQFTETGDKIAEFVFWQ